MKHNLSIRVSKDLEPAGILGCKRVSIREKLLTYLLGEQRKVTILIPGNSVETVAISEIEEGGTAYEQD